MTVFVMEWSPTWNLENKKLKKIPQDLQVETQDADKN